MIDEIPDTCIHGIYPVEKCTICFPKFQLDDNHVEIIDAPEK